MIASKLHYELIPKTTREFAYQYAKANIKCLPENWSTNKAISCDWLKDFMHRHKELSLRKPEPTSLSRATEFNKETVRAFFSNLCNILQTTNFYREAIFNVVVRVQKPGTESNCS